ncbi:hypothetical protein CEUSTIGMA_g10360.t1 [Chlamydomonas eustigma]|uniref:Chlorophyll(Ide) b reductase n=1 Tax=Chlamydomonas eustigma TaxID=1157962 RepID=A0A250XIR5_9CHLO|nr:hypothetical protein CEUSTIGMA_g10360.t1 [Chlamydomonas eustigma]|eukprot:GAX82933.1 hypothetical protein CEUSTIGMA_g10360.t1 [Chlamydomonas eustigma]
MLRGRSGMQGSCRSLRIRCHAQAATTLQRTTSNRAVPINPPYGIVITGSTKGVGRALAEEFLRQGDTVIISSRSDERVTAAVSELSKEFGTERVKGLSCNVSQASEVRNLADYARDQLGKVDIWINNAGTNAYKYGPLMESTDEDLMEIVQTNVLGIMLCCKEAVRVMREQSTGGHIFNMDGAGADGGATPRFAAYGATKRCLSQLAKSLQAELGQAQVKNVGIHNLSPGMVTTELLMSGADSPVSKFFINCLADTPEEVASFLVPRVRRIPQDNINPLTGTVNPSYVQYLTKQKAFSQIITRVLTGKRKDKFVKEG